MKKLKFTAIVLILLLSLSVSSFAIDIPDPTSNFYVNDFADVISSEDESEMMKIGVDLYNQTQAQVVVVTVDSLDGYDVYEYALELGRDWGVGSKESNTGVVLLLSVNDRQVSIQVGYGLEGCLTDAGTGRILDTYAIPYFSNDDFSTGLTEAYKAIVSVVCEEFGVESLDGYQVNAYQDEYYGSYYDDKSNNSSLVTALITLLIILFVIGLSNKRGRKGLFRTIFLGRVFGDHYDDDDDIHFGGGSFGGGGSSFGGGSGGFRGGGGSFGGGGASRGF